ncbi:MAG: ATP-binding protein [Nostoc sp.]|uniref:ATP-binding protein n=1 Tax=Nostoc sp. TaxID=1180 RepID=UPI002FF96204
MMHFKFSPKILQRLGEELIQNPDQGIIELVKNSYDADATECTVELIKTSAIGGSIIISDNGVGMDKDAISEGWLVYNVNELVSIIRANTQGAVCDHRLSNSGFANFYRAELVANLYDFKFPSLLITQYTEMDTSFSIRKWRHKIPVLLSREEADASSIAKGIEDCTLELSGKIPSTRKPRRTIVRITNINVAKKL